MTDEAIELLIHRLNRGNTKDIIIAPIAESVFWGFVYNAIPDVGLPPERIEEKGHEFFFVKAGDGQFAGAVHRFGPDEIHWLVAEAYRCRSLLVEPLKTTILPFIFARHRQFETQRGSLELRRSCAKQSASLAVRVGFQRVESSEDKEVYEIHRDLVPPYVSTRRPGPDHSHIEQLEREVRLGIRALHIALDTFEVNYSSHLNHNLAEEARTNLLCAQISLEDTMRYSLSL